MIPQGAAWPSLRQSGRWSCSGEVLLCNASTLFTKQPQLKLSTCLENKPPSPVTGSTRDTYISHTMSVDPKISDQVPPLTHARLASSPDRWALACPEPLLYETPLRWPFSAIQHHLTLLILYLSPGFSLFFHPHPPKVPSLPPLKIPRRHLRASSLTTKEKSTWSLSDEQFWPSNQVHTGTHEKQRWARRARGQRQQREMAEDSRNASGRGIWKGGQKKGRKEHFRAGVGGREGIGRGKILAATRTQQDRWNDQQTDGRKQSGGTADASERPGWRGARCHRPAGSAARPARTCSGAPRPPLPSRLVPHRRPSARPFRCGARALRRAGQRGAEHSPSALRELEFIITR